MTPKERHHNQMAAQVWLPLGLVILAALGLMVFVILLAGQEPSSTSQIASISEILLVLPLFMIGMVIFILTILFIFLFARLYRSIPLWSANIHLFILRIQLIVEKISHSITDPIIGIRSTSSAVKRAVKGKIQE